MGLRGPTPKSAGLRVFEGERAHRPLPAPRPKLAAGAPDRPKGMTAAARRIWDDYSAQLGGILRLADSYALRDLCEDTALLFELHDGARKLAADSRRTDADRLKEIEALLVGEPERGDLASEKAAIRRRRVGGYRVALTTTDEGQRLAREISRVDSRVKRAQLQFGVTPVSAGRLGEATAFPMVPVEGRSIEDALCG